MKKIGKLVAGETYTGEELLELCDSDGAEDHFVVAGKKATVIVFDAGNDNYTVECILPKLDRIAAPL